MPMPVLETKGTAPDTADLATTPVVAADGREQSAGDDISSIYAHYNSRVYYLCLRLTGNTDDAEDLSQEAFLKLIQKLETFRGESALYTWLRRLAINTVLLRFQKASWRHEVSLEGLAEPDPQLGSYPRGELAQDDLKLAGAIDRIQLERAMDQLPPGFKAVLVLHDIEGFGHAEISHLMGCSIGTSKSQLHKARMKMRQLLGGCSASSGDARGTQAGMAVKSGPVSTSTPCAVRMFSPRQPDFGTSLSNAA